MIAGKRKNMLRRYAMENHLYSAVISPSFLAMMIGNLSCGMG